MSNFLNRLQFLAEEAGDKKVLHWLDDVGREEATLSSREIWIRSGAVADKILEYARPGERCMIVYPFGLEFVIGLVACMRAGVIAVSVYPPSPGNFNKDIPKFNKYYEDCSAKIALTTGRYYMLAKTYGLANIFSGGASWPAGIQWVTTDFKCDTKHVRKVQDYNLTKSDTAFIQYTSGSTGNPKGVMISFGALDANLDSTKEVLGISQHKTTGVLWLPQYHDLGLVGGFLCTIYEGCTTYFLSPLTFIQNPLLWGELIQKHSATNIAAPTFAYSLLAKRIRQKQLRFDFTSLTNAIISAEPIRPSTLLDMEEIGIPPHAIDQAYGAAESIAFILSGGQGLERGVPSCGLLSQSAKFGKRVTVVDDSLLHTVENGVVGNVLITGPDLASGYWGKPELNKQVFDLQVPGQEGRWYKTGDLGFIKNDQLYLTGRKKDIIIIQGRNFYPQDLEWVAEEQFATRVRPGCVAAGQFDHASAFIVAELVPGAATLTRAEAGQLARAVHIAAHVPVKKVLLVKKHCLPKTTSGKIRRAATAEAVCKGSFPEADIVLEWTAADKDRDCGGDGDAASSPSKGIAIIGAGPAGMVAAHALVKRGYSQITVFERDEHVGGRSVGFAGYDEIYIGSGAYRAIACLASEFHVEFPYRVPGCKLIPPPVAMPQSDVVPERSLNDTMVLELWAKAGYGLATEDTPLHYTFGAFNEVDPIHFFHFPPNFFSTLWGNMQKSLEQTGVQFKLGHSVKDMCGRCVDGELFDRVVMTVMPQDAWQLTKEPSLKKLRTNRYGMVVFDAQGLDRDTYTFMAPHQDSRSVGQPLEIYKKSGKWYSLVYAQLGDSQHVGAVSEDQIVANLTKQVVQLGGRVDKVLTVKLWDFFPHADNKTVNSGFFERWEADMQGKGGVYWTGAFLGFDLTETVARHAQATMEKHFPSQQTGDGESVACKVDTREENEAWFVKTNAELYPMYPFGPSAMFPKYYSYNGSEGVHKSSMWMLDAEASLEIDPDRVGIPDELLQGFFGREQRVAATVRISELPIQPPYWPAAQTPTMSVFVGGNSFLLVGGLHAMFPGSGKNLYDLARAQLDPENDRSAEIVGPMLEWLRQEEVAQRTLDHVFDCTYHGHAGGDVFSTANYCAVLHLVPRGRYAAARASSGYCADSIAILEESGVELDLMVQYAKWTESEFFLDRQHFDWCQSSSGGVWDATKYPMRRLGALRLPKQEPVDHDAKEAWGFRMGVHREDFGWDNSFWPDHGCSKVYDLFKFLSTEEYRELSDGSVDVKHTLLAKVRQMVGSAEIDTTLSPLQLGLSSFQLVQLAKFVQSIYKADFPVTLFFDLATLDDVIEYIQVQTAGEKYMPQSLVKHCCLKGGQQVAFAAPDLWCFPPIIGSGVYRTLSKHLPSDFELCELMDLSFYADGLEDESIRSLAERYAAAIRDLQPTGPYKLGGFSFGSILAHAVSLCLGPDVASIIMLDGIAPTARATKIAKFTDSNKVNTFIHRQLRTGLSYKASRSQAVEVVLVVAEDQSFYDGTEVEHKATLGWLGVEPSLRPYFVPGSHATIMREPYVLAVADIVLRHTRPAVCTPRAPSLASPFGTPDCLFEQSLSSIHDSVRLTPRAPTSSGAPMTPSARHRAEQQAGTVKPRKMSTLLSGAARAFAEAEALHKQPEQPASDIDKDQPDPACSLSVNTGRTLDNPPLAPLTEEGGLGRVVRGPAAIVALVVRTCAATLIRASGLLLRLLQLL